MICYLGPIISNILREIPTNKFEPRLLFLQFTNIIAITQSYWCIFAYLQLHYGK